MIDEKLINKAKKKSSLLEHIDSSWREFVERLKEGTFLVPFKGEYSALVKGSSIFIEGYSGLLLIDRLCFKGKMYSLNTPVRYYPFKIYGSYDATGDFMEFAAEPEIGFHYLGLSGEYHSICTGDIEYINPESLGLLKEACQKIVKSFRVINLESIGTILLPDRYSKLKAILENKEEEKQKKLSKLIKENLITEII